MSEVKTLLSTSIAKKVFTALTGLFLCLFLVGHLAGNLQLMIPADQGARDIFNEYALFMTTNPAIKVMSYITYTAILLHVIFTLILTYQNKKARPVNYKYNNSMANSAWSSRNMAILGSVIFIFIVLHMKNFWFKMHWGGLPTYYIQDVGEVTDLYQVVIMSFKTKWYTALYVVAMVFIALHLLHGFQSAFQSLGLKNDGYAPFIKKVGYGFAILIPLAFAIIPIWIYFFI